MEPADAKLPAMPYGPAPDWNRQRVIAIWLGAWAVIAGAMFLPCFAAMSVCANVTDRNHAMPSALLAGACSLLWLTCLGPVWLLMVPMVVKQYLRDPRNKVMVVEPFWNEPIEAKRGFWSAVLLAVGVNLYPLAIGLLLFPGTDTSLGRVVPLGAAMVGLMTLAVAAFRGALHAG